MNIPFELPTASDFRATLAARALRAEERRRDPAVRAELARAREEASAAARLLKERFGASRVRLFGSLARGDTDEDFDIDLSVEGIDPRAFFAASAEAARSVSRRLDVIDLADASPLLRRRIEQDGVDLP